MFLIRSLQDFRLSLLVRFEGHLMRVAIYARYSSPMQKAASIEDQVRLCMERRRREGWTVVQTFTDMAISGASLTVRACKPAGPRARGGIDLVLCEALDRLSRDQADVATLYKQLSFHGAGIATLAEGEISELHVGLKGTMNQLFLKDSRRRPAGVCAAAWRLASPVAGTPTATTWCAAGRRRTTGHGRTHDQRGRGGGHPPDLHRVRGRHLAEGHRPGPERRRHPRPARQALARHAIRGHRIRGTGLLNNELYVGQLIWNRLRYVKDPATGKRVSRLNPQAEGSPATYRTSASSTRPSGTA